MNNLNPSIAPRPSQLAIWDVNVEYSFRAMPGIILAGVCYPVVLVLITLVIAMTENGFFTVSVKDFFIMLSGLAILASVACLLGLWIAAFSGACMVIVLNGINLLLGNVVDTRSMVGGIGGLAGYAPIAGLFLVENFASLLSVRFLIFGPTLAMFMGTFGAMAYLQKHYSHDVEKLIQLQHAKFQFRISQLLVITALVAMVFGVTSLARSPNFAIVVGYWVCTQALVVSMVRLLTKRINSKSRTLFVAQKY